MAHPWANRSILRGVYLTLCLNKEQFDDVCKKMKVTADWSLTNHGTTYYFESGIGNSCIVVIRDWETRPINQVLALIVHEATHVLQYTFKVMGEDAPGHEVEAYAMQNITQELFDLFDKLAGFE